MAVGSYASQRHGGTSIKPAVHWKHTTEVTPIDMLGIRVADGEVEAAAAD